MAKRDGGNKAQNERLKQLVKRRDHDDDEALRGVMQSEDGRRVVYALAIQFGWLGDGWDSQSARQTDFNAGRRSAGITLMEWAGRVAPNEFQAAIGEASRREAEMAELSKAAVMDTSKEQDDG